MFQSTLPTRGSDEPWRVSRPVHRASFNPRSPRGGATFLSCRFLLSFYSFNPRSPRGGATSYHLAMFDFVDDVSIHAPHEGERLQWQLTRLLRSQRFNPRSPRGGATKDIKPWFARERTFQSTLPTRGSDRHAGQYRPAGQGFNPRSPRGGATQYKRDITTVSSGFNPRSPRGGATRLLCGLGLCAQLFQSTLPTRGSDCATSCCISGRRVSIHAPHEGERR